MKNARTLRKRSLEVQVQLRWVMKNALAPAPPFG
jgi:hypothetical protein